MTWKERAQKRLEEIEKEMGDAADSINIHNDNIEKMNATVDMWAEELEYAIRSANGRIGALKARLNAIFVAIGDELEEVDRLRSSISYLSEEQSDLEKRLSLETDTSGEPIIRPIVSE